MANVLRCGKKSVVRCGVSDCSVLPDRSLQHKTGDTTALSLSLSFSPPSLSCIHSESLSCTPLFHGLPWPSLNIEGLLLQPTHRAVFSLALARVRFGKHFLHFIE